MAPRLGQQCRRRHKACASADLVTLAIAGAGLWVATHLEGFVLGGRGRPQGFRRQETRLAAWPWEGQGNPRADRAFARFAEEFPQAVAKGSYLGADCKEAPIRARFAGFEQVVGAELALAAIEKEPILLLREPAALRESWEYLKGLETAESEFEVADVVRKNPRLLTIPAFEFKRTKPTLDGLSATASAIDFIRPLGQAGLAFAIFGGFVVVLVILRPILYGVGGGPSLVGLLTGGLPSIPRPYEVFDSYGINLAVLVSLIPIYQVGSILVKKAFDGRRR